MLYVGLDPSISSFGVAVVERSSTGYRLVLTRRIRTKAAADITDRVNAIFDGVGSIIREFHPQFVGCEEQRNVQVGKWREAQLAAQGKRAFNADNSKTILAQGMALGACRAYGARVALFQPQQLKIAVMGKGGGSTKKEVLRARVIQLMGPAKISLDESDACAAAIAVAQKSRVLAAAG